MYQCKYLSQSQLKSRSTHTKKSWTVTPDTHKITQSTLTQPTLTQPTLTQQTRKYTQQFGLAKITQQNTHAMTFRHQYRNSNRRSRL